METLYTPKAAAKMLLKRHGLEEAYDFFKFRYSYVFLYKWNVKALTISDIDRIDGGFFWDGVAEEYERETNCYYSIFYKGK